MFEPRRQHPLYVLIHLFQAIRSWVSPSVFLVVYAVTSGRLSGNLLVVVGSSLIFMILIFLGLGFYSWRRYTYMIKGNELVIHSGIWVRKQRIIPQSRIQSIDLTEGIFHRLFGLVRVRIETAGGSEPEVAMDALLRSDAYNLQIALKKNLSEKEDEKSGEGSIKADQRKSERKLQTKELLLAGATSGGIGIVFPLIGGLFSTVYELLQMSEWWSSLDWFHLFQSSVSALSVATVLLVLFSVLFLSWMLAIVGTILTNAHFTVRREGNDLLLQRGWLEKKRVSIPLARIQAIRVVEGVLRQPFGLAALHVESAGFGNENGDSTVLFPLIRMRDIKPFLAEFVPEFSTDVVVTSLPKHVRKRYIVRSLWMPLVGVPVLTMMFYPLGLLSLFFIPPAVAWGWWKYRFAGVGREGNFLYRLRWQGVWRRTTVIVTRPRIQALVLKRNCFQRRARVCTVEVQIASGSGSGYYRVIDVDEKEGERWHDMLRNDKEKMTSSRIL
ncbi:PH domain-containing protein [Mechercharimyces sp. CAU 1602]|uniref:PH domain-containing protein n=1 Tax=Mechercharimyces sp. CAU 1602 TaxID=2973933 RepID=UPI00216304B6|nr:PH domain-containing protein [Mechercharimyces sp. CAU 1602]MCS1351606.1 PH domain-containing protein [Mechercharimyces sp. CAU 1602]